MKKILLSLSVSAGFITSAFAQAPVADFSGRPTTLCAGSSVTFTNLTTGAGGPGTTWAWSFPGATAPTSATQNPTPRTYDTPGTYTVTLIVTTTGGTDTMVKPDYITVLASPTITVTPSIGYICSIGSTTLTANGGNTYSWSPGASLNNTTGSVVVASPTTTTTYTVIGTNSNGCTSRETVSVSVNTSPPPTPGGITGSTTVCSGQTDVIYTVPNGFGTAPIRTWTVPSGAIITAGQGTRSVTITFGGTSGNVCCTASNACGASTPTCVAVTVNPTPQVGTVGTITGPSAVCANQTGVTYYIPAVTNAATYSWTATGGATITSGQGTTTVTIDFGTNNSNICVTASNSCNTSPQVCQTVTISPNTPGIPGYITGPTTVCNGQAGVTYSVAAVPSALTYSWTISSGATITSGQGTRSVTITFGNSSGTVCVTAGNGCGTSAQSCQAITVDPNQAVGTLGTITGPTAVCANQSGVIYSIASVTGASTYSWTVPAGAAITAGQGTNTITVTYSVTAGNVCVTASNNCSTSSQKCIAITVSPNAPAIPGAIIGPTTVCNGQSGVIYSVASVANTVTYSWTIPSGATITSGQGTNTVIITFGSLSGTVCVTAGNGCGTSLPSCQAITVDPNPVLGTLGTITGPTAVCANQSGVTYTVASLTGASTYSWTVPAGAAITSGQGTNTITVTYSVTAGNVCVTASNSCSTSPQQCVAVTISNSAPAIPGAITGSTTVCNGQSGVTYFVPTVAGASTYSWTIPSGATIISGQGTRFVTIAFGSSSGTVCVTASNACGTSLPNCEAITVDPNPVLGTLGTITGPTAVCANQSGVTYMVASLTGASTYSWTVPAGATITSGQGTNTITVTYSVTAGNVCVTASNSCSTSPQQCMAVTVSPNAPVIPGTITGPTTVCNGQTGATYSISNVATATTYTWSVPTGATITSGQGTTSVMVTFGSASGNICVAAGNACGTSLPNCEAITVDPNPAVGTVGTINGPTAACANQTGVTYTIAAVTNAISYNWTVPAAATITAGQGTQTITVSFGNVSGNVCVVASNSCDSSLASCLIVTVSPNAPAIPAGITGVTTVCSGQAGMTYTISPVANALFYTWTVPAGATITSGQGTTSIIVTFGNTSGNICVSAGNGCGTSLQNCQAITVNSSVLNVPTPTTSAATCSSCCDGSATASPSGGTSPYTYSWNSSPPQTTATATGLCASSSYTVCVKDAIGCVTCSYVTIPFATGISTLTDNGTIKVYPNPANDELFIEGTLSGTANMQVSIINMFGQKMMDKNMYANGTFSEKMSIGSIPSGVYFIEIRSGEMVRDLKIVKIQ